MRARFNRREFLGTAASAGAVWTILSNSQSAHGYNANEKLNIAVIGAGGRGASNLAGVSSQHIVALCDVYSRRAADSFGKYSKAKKFEDYRKLLDRLDGQIDAVVVSTPNHVHAPASVTAMRMGKHVYCEKPLAHSVHEARVAANVARQAKVATQMGTQIHACDNYRRIIELIRARAIGQVTECHLWLRGGGSAGDRPQAKPPIPSGLNWDVWLGPAPYRPYHPCYVPHDWHYWWDFGGGAYGNMGCHYLDMAFWALDLRYPDTIKAEGPPPHPESTPAWQHVRYGFPTRGTQPPVTLTWTHGHKAPPVFQENKFPGWAWGVFVGTQGMLLVSYGKHMLWPADKFLDYQPPKQSIPQSIGHHREWIKACKTGSPTLCNFDYSGAVTETLLLGNIAYRVGEQLTWNGADMTFMNAPQANDLLQRAYRPSWTL